MISASTKPVTNTRSLIGVIGASSVGTLIEWYDFYIFGSLATVLATKFFPEGNQPRLSCRHWRRLRLVSWFVRLARCFLVGWAI